ncbi:MAG: cation transporter [Myxococcales bacterium]|nr:cation transporter [Myxococcales bacterium]
MRGIYRRAERALLVGLAINFSLGLAKVIGGVIGSSYALIADSLNSFGDSVTSIATYCALRIARRPPDERHPYGYARAEGIAASSVALVVVISALAIGWGAIERLGDVHGAPPLWTLVLAAANVVIKEGLFRYHSRVGRRTGSEAMLATAWDHRSDALSSAAVFVGLFAVTLGGSSWAAADDCAALFVSGAIVWAAGRLYVGSLRDLMDPQAEQDFVAELRASAAAVEGVRELEKFFVRKVGLEYFVDVHLQVERTTTVEAGHRIGHRVKDRLIAAYPRVADVLVHLEPFRRDEEQSACQASAKSIE